MFQFKNAKLKNAKFIIKFTEIHVVINKYKELVVFDHQWGVFNDYAQAEGKSES